MILGGDQTYRPAVPYAGPPGTPRLRRCSNEELQPSGGCRSPENKSILLSVLDVFRGLCRVPPLPLCAPWGCRSPSWPHEPRGLSGAAGASASGGFGCRLADSTVDVGLCATLAWLLLQASLFLLAFKIANSHCVPELSRCSRACGDCCGAECVSVLRCFPGKFNQWLRKCNGDAEVNNLRAGNAEITDQRRL